MNQNGQIALSGVFCVKRVFNLDGNSRYGVLVLCCYLAPKFQQAAEPYFQILDSLSVEDLELLGDRLVTESSLEAIFEGFPTNHS